MRLGVCRQLVLLLSVLPAAVSEDSSGRLWKLVHVVEVFRHGARTPLAGIGADPRLWGGLEEGQLTPVGMRQHYALGRYLRQRYVEDLGLLKSTYDPTEVVVRSTQVPRTLGSAQAHLHGLFPPNSAVGQALAPTVHSGLLTPGVLFFQAKKAVVDSKSSNRDAAVEAAAIAESCPARSEAACATVAAAPDGGGGGMPFGSGVPSLGSASGSTFWPSPSPERSGPWDFSGSALEGGASVVPIFSTDKSDDALLLGIDTCQGWKERMIERGRKEREAVEKEVSKTGEWKLVLEYLKDRYGVSEGSFEEIEQWADSFLCLHWNGLSMGPLPKEGQRSPEEEDFVLFQKAVNVTVRLLDARFTEAYGHEEIATLGMEPLARVLSLLWARKTGLEAHQQEEKEEEWAAALELAKLNMLKEKMAWSRNRYLALSAHDTTLAQLLGLLGIYKVPSMKRQPPFAASFAMELWEDPEAPPDSEGRFAVGWRYNGRDLDVRESGPSGFGFCPHASVVSRDVRLQGWGDVHGGGGRVWLCELPAFLNFLAKRTEGRKFEEECQVTSSERERKVEEEKTGLVAAERSENFTQ